MRASAASHSLMVRPSVGVAAASRPRNLAALVAAAAVAGAVGAAGLSAAAVAIVAMALIGLGLLVARDAIDFARSGPAPGLETRDPIEALEAHVDMLTSLLASVESLIVANDCSSDPRTRACRRRPGR